MKFNYVLKIIILFFLSATALANTIIVEQDKPVVVLTRSNPQFTIELKSNPSTGYVWLLQDYANYLIQPVSHRFKPGDKKLIGAPGIDEWTFYLKPSAFVVPQQTHLKFVYVRPWEMNENVTPVVFQVVSS